MHHLDHYTKDAGKIKINEKQKNGKIKIIIN